MQRHESCPRRGARVYEGREKRLPVASRWLENLKEVSVLWEETRAWRAGH